MCTFRILLNARQKLACRGGRSADLQPAFGRRTEKAGCKPALRSGGGHGLRGVSLSQQLFQPFPRRLFAAVFEALLRPFALDELEILAEIPHMLFEHRLRSPLPALLGHPRIVRHAVQADPEVRPALHANLAAARVPVQRPRLPAIMTMTIHTAIIYLALACETSFLGDYLAAANLYNITPCAGIVMERVPAAASTPGKSCCRQRSRT